jgi:uncharacterized membrane protein YkoI
MFQNLYAIMRFYGLSSLFASFLALTLFFAPTGSFAQTKDERVGPTKDDVGISSSTSEINVEGTTDPSPGKQVQNGSSGNAFGGTAKRTVKYALILKNVKQEFPGDIVNVRLQKSGGSSGWKYEFTILDRKGQYTLVTYNALTGRKIGTKRQ